jgi:hypothetical protein
LVLENNASKIKEPAFALKILKNIFELDLQKNESSSSRQEHEPVHIGQSLFSIQIYF